MNGVMASPHTAGRTQQLLLVVLVSLALITMIDQLPRMAVPLSEHAIAQHGGDAVTAKQCLDDDQLTPTLFWNPTSQRWGVACWLGDRWGLIILTATWLVITAFVTTKLRSREQVSRYMKRRGYDEQGRGER